MKPIHSIVCIKPIPDPAKWDRLKLDPETMILCRDEIPAVINPLDRNAIEQAMQIKEINGGSVSVISMAPPEAEEQLREALAMGCDQAYLLTDPAFSAADTLATARPLKTAIEKIGNFDLVFCGAYSLDGSTAQVGPQIAELLGIPDLTHVFELEVSDGSLRAHCRLENGYAIYESPTPALVTLDQDANVPRFTGMVGISEARDKEVVVWSAADLKLAPESIGLAGSPTQMSSVFTPPVRRKGEILQGSANEACLQLIQKLRKEKLLG